MKIILLIRTLFLGAILFIVIILSNHSFRDKLKKTIWDIDVELLNGLLKRIYMQQPLPEIPKSSLQATADAYLWIENSKFLSIAHRLGPTISSGANTLKTFKKGREMGFKTFEVDIFLTQDNNLICYSGLPKKLIGKKSINQIKYFDYKEMWLEEGKEICEFSDLVNLAKNNNNIKFIIDIKNYFEKIEDFKKIYQLIQIEISDSLVAKSFIPQVYNFEQVKILRSKNFFAGEIFTSYKSALTIKQIFNYASFFNIKVVTIPIKNLYNFKGKIPENIIVLTHAVNDTTNLKKVYKLGVRGVYSSFLNPKLINESINEEIK